MKTAIVQNCGKAQTAEDFYNWKAGQEAIAQHTGFEYAFYNPKTKEIKGFYVLEHAETELQRGQHSVNV